MNENIKLGEGYARWRAEVEARQPIAERIAKEATADAAWRKELKAARAGHPKNLSERIFDGPRAEKKAFRSRIAEEAAQREFDEGFLRDG